MSDNQVNKINNNESRLTRIATIIQKLELKNYNELAKRIGISHGFMSEIRNTKKDVPKTFGQKLEDKLGVSRRWFETGEGPMMATTGEYLQAVGNSRALPASNARLIGDIYESEYEEGARFRPLGNDRFMMKVDLVTQKAQAGFLRGFADPEYHETLPTIEIIVDFVAKGNYLCFDVEGDSMDDDSKRSIPDKSQVTGREVPQHMWMPRLYNHEWPNWIFVHKTEGVLVKQIADQNLEEGWIEYTCLNPNKELYPNKRIFVKDIYKIYNVVKVQWSY